MRARTKVNLAGLSCGQPYPSSSGYGWRGKAKVSIKIIAYLAPARAGTRLTKNVM